MIALSESLFMKIKNCKYELSKVNLTQKNLSYSKFETGPGTSFQYPKISRELFRKMTECK